MRILLRFLAPVCVAFGLAAGTVVAGAEDIPDHDTTLAAITAKMIRIAVFDNGKPAEMRFVPPIDGATGKFNGNTDKPGHDFSVEENYKVFLTKGKFHVKMHRIVVDDGKRTVLDRDLPVWSGKPGADKRIPLNEGCSVVAYFPLTNTKQP